MQVDVFWSYGLNAGLALAASKAIKKESHLFYNKYFTLSLLWTASIFAPSGLYLLWENPGWETMFVARNHSSIQAWVACLFGFTNISQGVLGFWITARLIKAGRRNAACLQVIWSHALMFFILFFGWDGSGFRRFFYPGTGEEWHTGKAYPLLRFFDSQIFYTLLGMAVIFIPTYFGLIIWFRRPEVRVHSDL